DQLISLRLSEFAIAATVLKLDEPALLAVVIVNHGSCKCFDDLRHNRIKPAGRVGISMPRPGVDAHVPRRRASVVARGVSADLVLTSSAHSSLPRLCRSNRQSCRPKGSLMRPLTPARYRVQIGRAQSDCWRTRSLLSAHRPPSRPGPRFPGWTNR